MKNDLKHSSDAMAERISRALKGSDVNRKELDRLLKDVEGRYTELGKQRAGIMSQIENRVDGVRTRLDQLDKDLAGVRFMKDKIDTLVTDFGGVKTTVAEADALVKGFERRSDNRAQRSIRGIDQLRNETETHFKHLNVGIQGVRGQLTELDADFHNRITDVDEWRENSRAEIAALRSSAIELNTKISKSAEVAFQLQVELQHGQRAAAGT